MGVSEVVRAGSSATKSLIAGENVGKGLDRDMSSRTPVDRLNVKTDVLGGMNATSSNASTALTTDTPTLGAKGIGSPSENIGAKSQQTTIDAVANPTPPEMPPPPPPDDSAARAAYDLAKKTAAAEEKKRLRSRAGRASTILTGFGSDATGSGKRYLGNM